MSPPTFAFLGTNHWLLKKVHMPVSGTQGAPCSGFQPVFHAATQVYATCRDLSLVSEALGISRAGIWVSEWKREAGVYVSGGHCGVQHRMCLLLVLHPASWTKKLKELLSRDSRIGVEDGVGRYQSCCNARVMVGQTLRGGLESTSPRPYFCLLQHLS